MRSATRPTTMPDYPMKVDCRECSFSRIVYPDDAVLPYEVIIQHGKETDHKVVPERLNEEGTTE